MFTGLVQALGVIAEVAPTALGRRLVVDPRGWDHRPAIGDSVAVNGCCLTVAVDPRELAGKLAGGLAFDVVPETLRLTTLGALQTGSPVNLEHSVTPTTLMGGHMVQGHIDGLGVVESVQAAGEWRVRIRPPAALMELLIPKGSICVDGVSLTLAAVDPTGGTFEVALIPTTLCKTNLGTTRPGDRCNLETDILARTIVHWMKHYGSPGRSAGGRNNVGAP